MATTLVATGITFPDSTTQTTAATGGGLGGQTVFTSNGTFTIPTGKTVVKVTVVGGGQGGTGYGSSGCSTFTGGGGGSGATGVSYLTGLTPGNTITVTVGSGGSGGGTSGGGPGYGGASGGASSIASGTQTITTITASGGTASGSTVTGATLIMGGGPSPFAIPSYGNVIGGLSANSIVGIGVAVGTSTTQGTRYGAGGAGSSGGNGFTGFNGVVIFEY